MRLLVTGASGLVGSAVASLAAKQGHEVIAVVGGYAGAIAGATRKLAVNLADPRAAEALAIAEAPDAIINCAAVSVPEACEADPALADAMNVQLPAALAVAAKQTRARLVHISSEQAFDGTQTTPYKADAPVAPINLYGRQKVASEERVQAAAPGLAVTIRAPLLMGNSAAGKRSTHERLLGDWAAGRAARLYRDEFRQPCTAENLASVLIELGGRRELCGVFHWAGAELISRYDLGLRIREHFKLPEARAPIVAVTRREAPDVAKKRQACLALDVDPLAAALRMRPQTIAEQLAALHVPEPCQAWYESSRGG